MANQVKLIDHATNASIVMSTAAIVLQLVMLTGCGEAESKFDEWYEAVINEPYDPLNGSKY